MNELKKKLEEIIDFEMVKNNTKIDIDTIPYLQKKYKIKFSGEYSFYLQNYGNNYIKDGYRFNVTKEIESKLGQEWFDIISIFGLYQDTSNLEKNIERYNDILPENIFPIADLPGGNLVCMDRIQDEIYIWIHDEYDGLFYMRENFKGFINSFQFEEIRSSVDLNDVELNISDELDEAMRKAAEKYRK